MKDEWHILQQLLHAHAHPHIFFIYTLEEIDFKDKDRFRVRSASSCSCGRRTCGIVAFSSADIIHLFILFMCAGLSVCLSVGGGQLFTQLFESCSPLCCWTMRRRARRFVYGRNIRSGGDFGSPQSPPRSLTVTRLPGRLVQRPFFVQRAHCDRLCSALSYNTHVQTFSSNQFHLRLSFA